MTLSTDALILRIANDHHGACTRGQLLAAGLSTRAINRRVASGMLDRFGASVYLLSESDNEHIRLAAALLRFPDGVASTFSAACLHALPVAAPRLPEVLVPRGSRRQTPLVTVRESLHLPRVDLAEVDGLATTTPARTLCDVIPLVQGQRRNFIIDTALQRGITTPADIIACSNSLARQGRPGTVARRQLVDTKLGAVGIGSSELERLMAQLLVDYGIAGFAAQFQPPWFDGASGVVDFAYPDAKLIIEADGRTWHASEQAMQDDRKRDRLAARAGWHVLRFMWAEVSKRPAEVAAEIDAVLAQASLAA